MMTSYTANGSSSSIVVDGPISEKAVLIFDIMKNLPGFERIHYASPRRCRVLFRGDVYAKDASEYVNTYLSSSYSSFQPDEPFLPNNHPKQKEATGLLELICPKFISSPAILALVLQFAQVKAPRICSHVEVGSRRYLDVQTKGNAEMIAFKFHEQTSIVCLHTTEVCSFPGCGVGSRLQSTVYQHLQKQVMKNNAAAANGTIKNTSDVVSAFKNGPTMMKPTGVGHISRPPPGLSTHAQSVLQPTSPITYPSAGVMGHVVYRQQQPAMVTTPPIYYMTQPAPPTTATYPTNVVQTPSITNGAISAHPSANGTNSRNLSNGTTTTAPLFHVPVKKEVKISQPRPTTNGAANSTTSTTSISNVNANNNSNDGEDGGINGLSKSQFKFNLEAPKFAKFTFSVSAPEFTVDSSGTSSDTTTIASDSKKDANSATTKPVTTSKDEEQGNSKKKEPITSQTASTSNSSSSTSTVSSTTDTTKIYSAIVKAGITSEISTNTDSPYPDVVEGNVVPKYTRDAFTEVDIIRTRNASTSSDHTSRSVQGAELLETCHSYRLEGDAKAVLADMMNLVVSLRQADADGTLLYNCVPVDTMIRVTMMARSLHGFDPKKKVVWL